MNKKTAAEVEPQQLCISCAAKLGGKVDQWLKMKWAFDKCGVCGHKREVTSRKGYVWR